MRREFGFYLWDVQSAISDIQSFVSGMTFEQYLESRMAQRAVERSFEIIGEALKQADRNFPDRLNSLSGLSNATRFRDRLAHGYFTIKQEILWDVIHQELPELQEAVTKIMNALDAETKG